MLGDEVLRMWRVLDHDARDSSSLVDLGMVDDVPVLARARVGRGRPPDHHGLRRAALLRRLQRRPEDGRARPGGSGNDARASQRPSHRRSEGDVGCDRGQPGPRRRPCDHSATRVDFSLDVLLDDAQQITRAFAGETLAMHAAACAVARREAMRPVDAPFDVVITTNSGYPLDQNLYQAVKGMSAAAEVVRPGGTIICAAECRDGLPDHGSYGRLLAQGSSPADLLDADRSLAGHDP